MRIFATVTDNNKLELRPEFRKEDAIVFDISEDGAEKLANYLGSIDDLSVTASSSVDGYDWDRRGQEFYSIEDMWKVARKALKGTK